MTTVEDNTDVVSTDNDPFRFEEQDEIPTPTTIRDFFDSIDLYTYVHVPGRSTRAYIFVGWDNDAESNRVPATMHPRYMERTLMEFNALSEENRWETVKLEDGETVKQADQDLRMALRLLSGTRNELRQAGEHARAMEQQAGQNLADFQRVNQFINEYATNQNMCADYERRIFGWNESLVNKLEGRVQNYQVPVVIPAVSSSEMNVYPVQARTPEEARAEVESWSVPQLLSKLLERDYSFRDLEVLHQGTPVC